MNAAIQASIPADHPALEGHFPGHPVVPGSVLLEEVLAALDAWREVAVQRRIVSTRFRMPVPPGAAFTVHFREVDALRVRFEIHLGCCVAVSGEIAEDGREGGA